MFVFILNVIRPLTLKLEVENVSRIRTVLYSFRRLHYYVILIIIIENFIRNSVFYAVSYKQLSTTFRIILTN